MALEQEKEDFEEFTYSENRHIENIYKVLQTDKGLSRESSKFDEKLSFFSAGFIVGVPFSLLAIYMNLGIYMNLEIFLKFFTGFHNKFLYSSLFTILLALFGYFFWGFVFLFEPKLNWINKMLKKSQKYLAFQSRQQKYDWGIEQLSQEGFQHEYMANTVCRIKNLQSYQTQLENRFGQHDVLVKEISECVQTIIQAQAEIIECFACCNILAASTQLKIIENDFYRIHARLNQNPKSLTQKENFIIRYKDFLFENNIQDLKEDKNIIAIVKAEPVSLKKFL